MNCLPQEADPETAHHSLQNSSFVDDVAFRPGTGDLLTSTQL